MELADLKAIAEKEALGQEAGPDPLLHGDELPFGPDRWNVKQALQTAVQDAGLDDQVDVCEVGCMRLCCEGPLVQVDPAGLLYERVEPAHAPSIVAAAFGGPDAAARRGDPHQAFLHPADEHRS